MMETAQRGLSIPSDRLGLTRSPDISCLRGEDLGCPNVEGFSTDRDGSSEECSGGGHELHDD